MKPGSDPRKSLEENLRDFARHVQLELAHLTPVERRAEMERRTRKLHEENEASRERLLSTLQSQLAAAESDGADEAVMAAFRRLHDRLVSDIRNGAETAGM